MGPTLDGGCYVLRSKILMNDGATFFDSRLDDRIEEIIHGDWS